MKHITWKLIFGLGYLVLAAFFANTVTEEILSDLQLRLFVLFTVSIGVVLITNSLRRTNSDKG